MSGYKLADGTDGRNVKLGDKFILNEDYLDWKRGDLVTLILNDGSDCPRFENDTKKTKNYCYFKRLVSNKKQFTKSDLKDGMMVVCRDGMERYVLGNALVEHCIDDTYTSTSKLATYANNLLKFDSFYKALDIMKVIDRDGTVLFERVEAPAKSQQEIEIDKLQKQIAELSAQADKLKASMK